MSSPKIIFSSPYYFWRLAPQFTTTTSGGPPGGTLRVLTRNLCPSPLTPYAYPAVFFISVWNKTCGVPLSNVGPRNARVLFLLLAGVFEASYS